MNLLDLARNDLAAITGNPDDFGTEIVLQAPGGQSATVTGIASKIHFGIDSEGNTVNQRQAHAAIAEVLLATAGYPVRDNEGKLTLKHHKLTYADSAGNEETYLVEQAWPDEMLGLILMTLGRFKQA